MRKKVSRRPAVFLDRDGTLIQDVGYLSRLSQVKLFKGAAEAIRELRQSGYTVLVVTNQSGVARGYFKESLVRQAHRKIQSLLKPRGTRIDGFFYCPHYPKGIVKSYTRVCSCRKPKPGMVKEAARRYSLDLKRSYVVGDKVDDLLLAQKAELAGGLLVRTGYGKKSEKRLFSRGFRKVVIVPNLLKAVHWILANKDKK